MTTIPRILPMELGIPARLGRLNGALLAGSLVPRELAGVSASQSVDGLARVLPHQARNARIVALWKVGKFRFREEQGIAI
jgi:hypothetical protein